jgi:hypothetical protein
MLLRILLRRRRARLGRLVEIGDQRLIRGVNGTIYDGYSSQP